MASFAIFDENFYLSNYPDVAAAVIAGSFSSGLQHFQLYGLADNRFLVSPNYNETIYLQRYPDVAAAVAAGVAAGDSVLVYPILSFMGMLTVALEILCSEEILSSQTGRGTREGENTPPDASSEETLKTLILQALEALTSGNRTLTDLGLQRLTSSF